MKSRRLITLALAASVTLCGCPEADSTPPEPEPPGVASGSVAPGSDPGVTTPESPATLLETARRFHYQDRPDEAMRAVESLLALDPDNVPGLLIRAAICERFESFENSLEDYGRAIELDDECAAAYSGRARCLAEQGDIDGALADMRRAAELAPDRYRVELRTWRRAADVARLTGKVLVADLELMKAEVTAIRGLPIGQDLSLQHQSLEDYGARVAASLDEEFPRASRKDLLRGMRRLGLLSEEIDLGKELTDALMAMSAAYYAPERDALVLLGENLPLDVVEPAVAHELARALQHQHFALARFLERAVPEDGAPRNVDRVLALRTVLAGEAKFVQAGWQVQQMRRRTPEDAVSMARTGMEMLDRVPDRQLISMTRARSEPLAKDHPIRGAADRLDDMPRYVLMPLISARFSGARMVAHLHGQGGWKRVATLYENPPDSMEQCLHPEKLEGNRDRPTPMRLPELPEFQAEGFRRIDTAVHGELYLRLLLSEQGWEDAVAKKATAGWDGDVYAAYARGKDEVAFVLATTWDKPNDAVEFFHGYRHVISKKYADFVLEDVVGDGNVYLYECGPKRGYGALRRRDREVFVVEGVSKELRSKLLARLGQMEVEHVE